MKLIDENLTEIVPECEQNGAGPKGFGFLVPDKLGLVNIEKAANIHDCHYYLISRFWPIHYKMPWQAEVFIVRRGKQCDSRRPIWKNSELLNFVSQIIQSEKNQEFFKALSSKKSAIKYANETFYKNLKIINKSKSPTRFGYIMRKPIIWAYYKAVTKFGRYFV